MNVADFLRAARRRIETPEHWIKGSLCLNENGLDVDLSEAACFCAVGALYHVADDEMAECARAVLDKAAEARGFSNADELAAVNFNDALTTTHADVLRLYDLAIEMAERA